MNDFADLPLPAGNGTGAPINVEALGKEKTVAVSKIAGPQKVFIEFSCDPAAEDSTFIPLDVIETTNNFRNVSAFAKFMRTRVTGFQNGVSVAGEACVGGSLDSSVIGLQTGGELLWRPGAVGANAPGENVFVGEGLPGWLEIYGKLDLLRAFGGIRFGFDSRFSSVVAGNGAKACAIPVGAWDFENATWDQSGDVGRSTIDLLNGALISNLLNIVGNNLDVIFDGVGPVSPFTNQEFALDGRRVVLFNTIGGAYPMVSADAGFSFLHSGGNNTLGGIANFGSASPAPVFQSINGAFGILAMDAGFVNDNAMGDDGASLISLDLRQPSACDGLGFFGPQNYVMPLAPSLNIFVAGRLRRFFNPKNDATPVVVAADSPYQADYNEVVEVDTTGGPVIVTARNADPARGEIISIVHVGGDAAASPVTFTAEAGDTVDDGVVNVTGAARTWSPNGRGTWRRMSAS